MTNMSRFEIEKSPSAGNEGDTYDSEEEEQMGLLLSDRRTAATTSQEGSSSSKTTLPKRNSRSKQILLVAVFLIGFSILAAHFIRAPSSTNSSKEKLSRTDEKDHDSDLDSTLDTTDTSNNNKNKNNALLSCSTHELNQPVILSSNNNNKQSKNDQHDSDNDDDDDKTNILKYACPCQVNTPAANLAGEDHLHYDQASQKILQNNVTNYLQVFRNLDFDDWGHSYTEVKQGMLSWKRTYFADELHNGSSIYESACGTGMNLYMTLEILQETVGTEHLVVYGNEYVTESVHVANEIAQRGALPGGGRLGTICPGDSTDLKHVPADSFDLVFTGYIAPLVDPLSLNKGSSNANFAQYTAWCQQNDDEAIAKRRQAQHAQNKWYGEWVQEMVRIAKPGAPVIVEQVSYPLCEAIHDWGGVNQDFWKDAAVRRNWDIDLDSIRFQDDVIFRKRYHVFMRKNS